MDQISDQSWQDEVIVTFIESSETVHLLAMCFENLKKASSLMDILFGSLDVEGEESDCCNLVLSALAMATFPRKTVTICILPHYVPGQRYRALTLSPQTRSPYIKGLKIDSPKLNFLEHLRPKELQERCDAKASNDTGYNLQNYSPTFPELSKFVEAIHDVEILEIEGCDKFPRLRFCNGCHGVFAKYVASTHFSHLTCLRLDSIYISGSRLRLQM
jgi:hypothetical protein